MSVLGEKIDKLHEAFNGTSVEFSECCEGDNGMRRMHFNCLYHLLKHTQVDL